MPLLVAAAVAGALVVELHSQRVGSRAPAKGPSRLVDAGVQVVAAALVLPIRSRISLAALKLLPSCCVRAARRRSRVAAAARAKSLSVCRPSAAVAAGVVVAVEAAEAAADLVAVRSLLRETIWSH